MKRLLIVLLGNLLSFSHLFAGDIISVNPFVTLEINENEYIVEYTSPHCEERDTTFHVTGGEHTFSHIIFSENDVFDYMEGEGIPQLPFLSLELQLPDSAEINVEISDIKYLDLSTGNMTSKKISHKLRHDYMPAQLCGESEQLATLQFDQDAYNDSNHNTYYRCSEQGKYLGTNGFTFSISPILYTPSQQSITPIAYAKYTITVSANNSLKRTTDTYAIDRSSSVSPEILSFYDKIRAEWEFGKFLRLRFF